MVEGVVAANDLSTTDADRVRAVLWQAMAEPAVAATQVA